MSDGDPLKLFWWKDQPNFGDIISRTVVEHASGRKVVWAAPEECDLFAIGSIMQFVRRTHAEPRADGSKPWIWGTGCMGPLRKDFKENVNFALVRGPITASLMSITADHFGDPGLLIADAMKEKIDTEERIGIVPHFSQFSSEGLQQLVKDEPMLKLIDVRKDAAEVCREIASCVHVISSSLHGLIVADSFEVPNTWLNPAGIHRSPRFKFYDYAASVERPLPPPIRLADIKDFIRNLPRGDIAYSDGIAKSKYALMKYFPAALHAKADT